LHRGIEKFALEHKWHLSTNLARLAQYSRRIEHYITQTRHLIHHLVANKKAIKVRIILKFTLEYTILLIVG